MRTKKVKKNLPVKKNVMPELNEKIVENLVLRGDVNAMSPEQKVQYYVYLCKSLGLNPATQPFGIIKTKDGKEIMYAKKDCTEQLRKKYGISITSVEQKMVDGICITMAAAKDAFGRTDASTGAVSIRGLVGKDFANAIMIAETKAKRRVTLSISGLGMLDETEIESIPGGVQITSFPENGKIENGTKNGTGGKEPNADIATAEEVATYLRNSKSKQSLVLIATTYKVHQFTREERAMLDKVYLEREVELAALGAKK